MRTRVGELLGQELKTLHPRDRQALEGAVNVAPPLLQTMVLTREWVIDQLIDNVKLAKRKDTFNLNAANKALELLGREVGMFVERREAMNVNYVLKEWTANFRDGWIAEHARTGSIDQVVWQPLARPANRFVSLPLCRKIFFGGARGGGKTDGVLGKWAGKEKRFGENFNAIMFRRSTVSSEDAIERSKDIYGRLGGTFNEQSKKWRMPNGGRVAFAYLDRMSDANEYQGRNVTDAWVEEVGQYPDAAPIDRLFGVLRSAHGVPVQLVLTGNPGGSGQHWIKSRYRLAPFPRRAISADAQAAKPALGTTSR